MKEIVVFSTSVAVRLLAVIAEHYAAWLLDKIGDGAERGLDLLADFKEFVRWLLASAARVRGRRGGNLDYDDWHRGYQY